MEAIVKRLGAIQSTLCSASQLANKADVFSTTLNGYSVIFSENDFNTGEKKNGLIYFYITNDKTAFEVAVSKLMINENNYIVELLEDAINRNEKNIKK